MLVVGKTQVGVDGQKWEDTMAGAEAVPILELTSVTIIRISDLRFRFIYAVSLSRYSVQTSFGTLPSDLLFRLIYAVSFIKILSANIIWHVAIRFTFSFDICC